MKKRILTLVTALLLVIGLTAGCSTPAPAAKTDVRVAALMGPTGMGLARLMDDQDAGTTQNNYTFTLAGAPDDIVGKITSGEVDIAAVPSNLAASLYNKTNGNVQLLAINTLGILYVVEDGDTIQSIADLKGKTVYASGQGSTAEYSLNHILTENGINPKNDVTIEYKSEHSELATLVTSGDVKLAVLPEPFVTTVRQKNKNVRVALDLTDEWTKIEEDSQLAMGVMIVRKEFAAENPEAVQTFLNEYKASTEYVNANVDEAGTLIEKYGILPSAAIARQAIPNCNIVLVDGAEMKAQIAPLYQILFDANPKSIGGKLPDDAFYYGAQ
jgi:NitT/TauT family transport system substrate-binding protein